MNKNELLTKLERWRDIVDGEGGWHGEDDQAYDKIVATIKNQPTITKRELENCAGAIQYSVQEHEDWGYVEDIIKEMLEDIGVNIQSCKEAKS